MDMKTKERLNQDINFVSNLVREKHMDIMAKYVLSDFGTYMMQAILLELGKQCFIEDNKRRRYSIQVEFKPMRCIINLYYDFQIIIKKDGSLQITTFKKLLDGVSFEKHISYIIQKTVEQNIKSIIDDFIASFNEWDRKHRGDD